ncbi:hypothetical protein FOA52_007414 [Chlamydomonas sp. UWO 241]|nr:hypothetical protein FOA52_007414 [Chlamydomonas sp. UWO 241]
MLEHQALIAARPATIWALLAPARWCAWDPDLKSVEQKAGAEALSEGFKVGMTMHSGVHFVAHFSKVVENQHYLMTSKFFGGFAGCVMEHVLEDQGEGKTKVTYRFTLNGPVGSMLQWVQHGRVADSVLKGFEQLKELAEKEEAK